MITVGATILASVPARTRGGPLWKPLVMRRSRTRCRYFITLLLVPVFYAIFVLDLKVITWDVSAQRKVVGLAQVTIP